MDLTDLWWPVSLSRLTSNSDQCVFSTAPLGCAVIGTRETAEKWELWAEWGQLVKQQQQQQKCVGKLSQKKEKKRKEEKRQRQTPRDRPREVETELSHAKWSPHREKENPKYHVLLFPASHARRCDVGFGS